MKENREMTTLLNVSKGQSCLPHSHPAVLHDKLIVLHNIYGRVCCCFNSTPSKNILAFFGSIYMSKIIHDEIHSVIFWEGPLQSQLAFEGGGGGGGGGALQVFGSKDYGRVRH